MSSTDAHTDMDIQPVSHTSAPADTHTHSNTHPPDTHTGVHADAHHAATGTENHHHGGLKEKVASVLRSPAVKKHDKVLAHSVDHIVAEGGGNAADHPDLPENSRLSSELNTGDMTEHEKAKLLKKERVGNALNDEFVLANATPALVSPGYGQYYGVKAATQNRT